MKVLGLRVWVAFRTNDEASALRCPEASNALQSPSLIRALAGLPLEIPIPHAWLPHELWPVLTAAPGCVVQTTHEGFIRMIIPPVEPLLVIAQSDDWRRGLSKTSRFNAYCRRAVHLRKPPKDGALCALEASVAGVGVAVGEEVVVHPAPTVERPISYGLWGFAEEILRQCSVMDEGQHAQI